MANHKTYHTARLSNWFLIATFLLSVFLFSGYAGNAKTTAKTTQTEFVSLYKNKTVRRTLCCDAVCPFVYSDTPLSIRGYETGFIVNFNRLTKIRIDHNVKQCLSINPHEQFRPIKTIPQTTNGDITSTLLG